jgi:hypothetical protein
MNRNKLILFFAIFVALILVLCFFAMSYKNVFFYFLGGIDRDYYNKMESIEVGMTEEQVIRILGLPDNIITESDVYQFHGLPDLYGKPVKNLNKVLVYYHGIDTQANYFIDKSGKVYFVNVGGT